jgi:acyl-CoA thioesterase
MTAPLHPLDDATTLTPAGERLATGRTTPHYWNMAGPFGGVTAATVLRAVLEDPARIGDPIALTVNFCAAVTEGAFEVAWTETRAGKTVQHWNVEMRQGGRVVTTASVVCAARRETWTHRPGVMPAAPPVEAVERLDTGGRLAWLERYSFRYVEGPPRIDEPAPLTPRSPRSVIWLRDQPARPLDYLSLAALADAFIVRIVQVRGRPTPMGTVTLTTYFHAGQAALDALGATPVLGVADAKIFHDNFADQDISLWSQEGTLLATGVQAAWFRE